MTSRDRVRHACLAELIRLCLDGTACYRKAARLLPGNPDLRSHLLRDADRRARFAQQLISYVTAAGGSPPARGPISGGLEPCPVTRACRVHGAEPRVVLDVLDRLDDELVRRYELALESVRPSDLARATMAAQLAEIRMARGRLVGTRRAARGRMPPAGDGPGRSRNRAG